MKAIVCDSNILKSLDPNRLKIVSILCIALKYPQQRKPFLYGTQQ